MNKLYFLLNLLFSSYSFSAAQVDYLNISGDAVYFSTAEIKAASSPSCAVAETNNRYAFSLRTDAGRAMYSLLITAMAGKQAITVDSAQDCADIKGVERVHGISFLPSHNLTNSNIGTKAVYLFNTNGEKVGRIMKVLSESSMYS